MDNLYWDTGIDRSMVKDKKMFWSQGMDGGESVLKGIRRLQRNSIGIYF